MGFIRHADGKWRAIRKDIRQAARLLSLVGEGRIVQEVKGIAGAKSGVLVMTRIALDAAAASKFHDLTQVTEVCDPAGNVLGRYIPTPDLSEWEPLSPEVSEEELDRRERSNEWYTFTEVMAHLKSLENRNV
jgi:hypothetical protein